MRCVVLVPGIMGSELVDGSGGEVWPPRLRELVFGYDRIDELMGDDVVAGGILRNVAVVGVYKSLLDDIERCGYRVDGPDRRFVPYPYDWRRSNVDAARGLADRLDELAPLHPLDEIVLIGHSMGGLVTRYLLESGEFDDRDWFPNVKRLITMGTPHFGAPKALAQLLGNDETLGVSGRDLIEIASDPRYPSLYQLVPPSGTALTVPHVPRGQVPTSIDSFDPAIAAELGLNGDNIASAQDFWRKLDLSKRPAVDYYLFGCAAHTTAVRNEWDEPDLEPIERRDAGDGTVPISSSIVPELAHGFSMKRHTKIFEDRNLRTALYEFLDAPAGVRPQAADHLDVVGDINAFGISIDKDAYFEGERIEIVASYNRAVKNPSESFQIRALDPDTGEPVVGATPNGIDITFEGVEMTSFSVVVAPDLARGLYELAPIREVDDPEPTLFTVVKSDA